MKILFTVCGRAGSKGIKNKNIKEFLGYPLIFYTLSAIDLYQKKYMEDSYDIALNTDSEEMMDLTSKDVVMPINIIRRKSELGLDHTPKIAVLLDSLLEMEARTATMYDMVVDLDITSPLRTVADIKRLIEQKKNGNSDVVFSVTESRRNPYFNMVKRKGVYYTRVIPSEYNARQEAPEIFDMNASLYAFDPHFIKTGKNLFEGNCDIIKMFDTAVLDLDHEQDFKLMEIIAAYLFDQLNEFGEIRQNVDKIIGEIN
ncbi:MAG: CMP-N-acetylneuraminic acid synthetase [Bacillota bacterium]|jgi:CMP-N,N'-diacetyllegionaminic acid synthase|nr:CMP-N-acetylneuraminic acid synthetase [Bacillota bacterium]